MSFHSGEIAVQTQAGVREEAQRLCSLINNVIKPTAQEFLRTQQLVIASTVDAKGRVWASLLTGQPAFVEVLNQQTLQINAFLLPENLLYQNLHDNPHIGLLVIDLVNRRRLRLNGKAEIQPAGEIKVSIEQAFFNCPKYIQVRHLETGITESLENPVVFTRQALNEKDKYWITQADTFFIASSHPEVGADASHRGGYPGFVQVVHSNKLVFPDYAGNNMFQTFGNLAINASAGLLFIDFEKGHTLQLTGKAEVIWDAERLNSFTGAQRLVNFEINQILVTQNATPLRWRFGEYSPVNPK
ncbi:pyridoxamine 5'-phosphate oxidase family protein [Fischerella sp. JS2]|uniref:pyridoxamine 5'-phosphate oxidase family protein n=1 Tax=Fischerella sp. JS2 TaxID=2597771 RepID=UPI0028EE9CD3|nr:pyridoxamine 5'-phosphate oxidase family protein [Fischerella sp. JS2]